ncbi:MAG: PH domain-containing protein [Candidatus Yanofskybacteria bacterium]|nr:PH domain-containing protein [Candidatus Yanofskybacteria bacterium]
MFKLRENEKLIKTVRQHRSVVVGAITWSVLFAGLVFWAFLKFKLNIFGYSWEIVIGAAFIAALIILYKLYIWRKNALIITNQRVILNIRQGIFSRTVTEFLYRDIYDISFKQSGLAALINRYGKLIIKTPSGNEITFDKVPSPMKVVDTINEIRGNLEIEKFRNIETSN